MAAIHELSAGALASAYARGDLSPVEATRAALERIAAWEPRLNALYLLRGEAALEDARDSERRWRGGEPRSRLDGVPVTIKENIGTRGDRSPIGTRANEHEPPQPADAPPAARAREAKPMGSARPPATPKPARMNSRRLYELYFRSCMVSSSEVGSSTVICIAMRYK